MEETHIAIFNGKSIRRNLNVDDAIVEVYNYYDGREGLISRMEVASRIDVDSYYSVYRDTLNRWGESASCIVPKILFLNMFRDITYGASIKLWLASFDGEVIAGAWILSTNNIAVYWHSAFKATFSNMRPMHYILYECLKSSNKAGVSIFDFCPSGCIEGVARFKKGFGARCLKFPVMRRMNPINRVLRRAFIVTCDSSKRCLYL